MSELISFIEKKEYKSAEQYVKKQKYIRWNDHQTQDGKSPLHLVAATGPLSLIQAMVTRGCPWDSTDHYGFTPIHYARKSNQVEVFLELCEMYESVKIQLPNEFISEVQSLYQQRRKFSVLDKFSRKSMPHDIVIASSLTASSSQGMDATFEPLEPEGFRGEKMSSLVTTNLTASFDDESHIALHASHESEIDLYNRYQKQSKINKAKYIEAKNNLELSLIDAGLSIITRPIKLVKEDHEAVKKAQRKLKRINEKLKPIEEQKAKTSSKHKHRKHHAKKTIKVDSAPKTLKQDIHQLFVAFEVSDSSLAQIGPVDIYYIALSLFHHQQPIDILNEIISAWHLIPNRMKPACIYFVMQVLDADSFNACIDTKPFKETFNLFLSQLESDIPAIARCAIDLRYFETLLSTKSALLCNDTVLLQALTDTRNLSEIMQIETHRYADLVPTMVEDLLNYHIWISTQLSRDLLKSKGWELLVDSFNKLSYMISFKLLTARSATHREHLAKLYLDVADCLVKNNEFHFAHSIFSAFNKSSISRLKSFDQFLSQEVAYIRLSKLFDSNRNFSTYRSRIKETGGLPYWGLLSNDFIHLAESDVNFNYYLVEGRTFSIVHELQNKFIGAPLHFMTNIVGEILNTQVDEELLNNLSREISPRTLNLREEPLAEDLIKNLQARVMHQLDLVVYDSELKLISGVAALDAIDNYIHRQLTGNIFGYRESKNIINLAIDIVQRSEPKLNTLPYLLALMSLSTVSSLPLISESSSSHEASDQLSPRTEKARRIKIKKKEDLSLFSQCLEEDVLSPTVNAVLTPRAKYSQKRDEKHQTEDRSENVVNIRRLTRAQTMVEEPRGDMFEISPRKEKKAKRKSRVSGL